MQIMKVRMKRMTMIFKKALLLSLAAVIAVSAPLTATAQPDLPDRVEAPIAPISEPAKSGSPDKGMETALIAAKGLIGIDDDVYTEFSYSSSFSNYEAREGLLWNFNWSGADGRHIYATVTAEGALMQFSKYSWDETSFGFADIDKKGAIAIADGFIKKANPDTSKYYKAPTDVQIDIRSSEYRFIYYAEINGYKFEAAQVSVNVNKFSGEVTGYSANRINPKNYRFEGTSGIIAESAAVAAYADKIGLSLAYNSYFDYESGNLKIFPVYTLNSNGSEYIGARSGDVVTYVYDPGVEGGYSDPSFAMESMAVADNEDSGRGGSNVNLTPSEIAAIEQAAKFITSEQALQKLLEAAELTNLDISSFSDQYTGLNRDYIDKSRYFYDINMNNYSDYNAKEDEIVSVYGRVDAVTGRVMSFFFNYFGNPPVGKSATTEAQAETAVAAFLRRVAPAELAKTKKDTVTPQKAVPYSYRGNSYQFCYIRHENDVPFRDNSINVTFNANTGKITGYSLHWYDNVSFPSIGNALAQQRALAEFVGQNGSKINYITTGGGDATLVYSFGGQEYIDPFTGKALDYTGEPWVDSAVTPDYSDAGGHWSEAFVTKLLDNGVFLWGGKFEPEKVMTELEFLQYLMLTESYGYFARVDAQAFFAQRGVKVDASPDKLLTRQEAARILVEYLGYGKLAGQSQWFVYPFADNVAEEYMGYITISYMLGIISGDAGRFNAANNVTRAHAAVMLHNLIMAKS